MVERLRPEIYPNHESGTNKSDILHTSGGIAGIALLSVIATGLILCLLSRALQSKRTGFFDYQSRGSQAGHFDYKSSGTQADPFDGQSRGTQTDAE
ncbi:unnamed protein product [Fusarium graminearum]|uniref:Chromosome 3, complete genome n=2 Tax=Gibberella zeae TaxID=5518 RepID=A0A098E418_GIBZE|nr:unnamed protein product [Fusarium graminearum]CAF3534011.1 unnamed protein product [Fusarium graminearum]CAF3579182.1 unnamed protein product [Fusarium graminearum]CAG1961269.1 unnamed protein product [Fusarium graminearum]CAG1963763.1 unnamed protein product [Fusarium graminearum]